MQSQQPDNQRNLLVAIVLSIAVLVGWQMFYAGPKLKDEQARLKQTQPTATQPVAPNGTATPGSATPAAPGVPAPAGTARLPEMTRDAALAASPRIGIETPSLKGS